MKERRRETTQPSGTSVSLHPGETTNLLLDPQRKVLRLAEHPKSQHGDDSGTSIGQAHEDPKASLHLAVSFSAKAVAIVGLE